MSRNRLLLRLVLIIALVVVFFVRGGQHNPRMLKTFAIAIGAAVVLIAVRMAFEASRRKKAEQDRQLTSGDKNAELFSKPKDF